MKKRELHIGTGTVDQFGKAFVEKWKQAELGEAEEATVEHVYFTDLATLLKVLTAKRLELLRELQQHSRISVYELANRLERNYKNVHSDVTRLKEVGLISDDDGLTVPYTRIHAEIDLAA